MSKTAFRRRSVSSAVALALGVVIAGCTATTAPEHKASSASAVATAGAAASATPQGPAAYVPGGSAADNLPIFTKVILDQWAGGAGTTAKRYTDGLMAAGFERTTISATASKTTLGNDAESLQVAVLWQGKCILGQVGPSTGDPITTILPELADGGCFVGTTHSQPQ